MVVKQAEMQNFMSRFYNNTEGDFQVDETREHFFFGKFYAELGLERDVEVYSVK